MGLRPGSNAAISLLDSNNVQEWEAAFNSYSQSVKRLSQEKGKSDLVALDRWWCKEFQAAILSRGADGAEPYIKKEELIKVVQWKMWIGAVRPSLLAYAKATKPEDVEAKSREAFEHLPWRSSSSSSSSPVRVSPDAVKLAVKALIGLKGVGPATASAVLAALCGGCPFDADEVIDAVKRTGKRDYSVREYYEVHETLDAKAASLGAPWDAERVRKALWSRAMHFRFQMAVPSASSAPTPLSSSSSAASSSAPSSGVSPSEPSNTPAAGAAGAAAAAAAGARSRGRRASPGKKTSEVAAAARGNKAKSGREKSKTSGGGAGAEDVCCSVAAKRQKSCR